MRIDIDLELKTRKWPFRELETRLKTTKPGRVYAIKRGVGKLPTPEEWEDIAQAFGIPVAPDGHVVVSEEDAEDELEELEAESDEPVIRTNKGRRVGGMTREPANPACKRIIDQPEWCGLTAGDTIRVARDPRARFTFRRYVRQVNGHEYVEAVGGRPKHAHHVRCFKPEEVLDHKRRPVMKVWLAARPEDVKPVELPDAPETEEVDDDDE